MTHENIYKKLPHIMQNFMISCFNYFSYRKRYGGVYLSYRKIFKKNSTLALHELQNIQKSKFADFIKYAIENSHYYKTKLEGFHEVSNISHLEQLPILSKEDLRNNFDQILTIDGKDGIISKTGGTTGKSLKVIFTYEDMQERFAMIDNFREQYGYKLGKRTAWFSGKSLITKKDIEKNRFWKTDKFYNVRYYSTFHVNKNYLRHYLVDLLKYKPKYIVGFPSTISEIARYGIENRFDFPKNVVKAIFPTAETLTSEIKHLLESYFKCGVYDQYASSEGAPFIFECSMGNLHLELQSGVFEVLNDNNKNSLEGRLIVTSFTTHGTPLIRYDIGDRVKLANIGCSCGNNNPIVENILGREDDFIYSPQNGKINLGNISNTLKGVFGIKKFQVIQDYLDSIIIQIVVDKNIFSINDEKKFLSNWVDRVGESMTIKLKTVEGISVEKSGKFRLVKNNIKHLI